MGNYMKLPELLATEMSLPDIEVLKRLCELID
jgi:hypothetical protein